MKLSKALIMRLVWFVVGGLASIALNAGLFRLFHFQVGLNRFVAYGLALSLSAVVLFVWNYFVGFRTNRPLVGSPGVTPFASPSRMGSTTPWS